MRIYKVFAFVRWWFEWNIWGFCHNCTSAVGTPHPKRRMRLQSTRRMSNKRTVLWHRTCTRPNTEWTPDCRPTLSENAERERKRWMFRKALSEWNAPTSWSWNNAVHRMIRPKKKITYLIPLNNSFTLSTMLETGFKREMAMEKGRNGTANLLQNVHVESNNSIQYFGRVNWTSSPGQFAVSQCDPKPTGKWKTLSSRVEKCWIDHIQFRIGMVQTHAQVIERGPYE